MFITSVYSSRQEKCTCLKPQVASLIKFNLQNPTGKTFSWSGQEALAMEGTGSVSLTGGTDSGSSGEFWITAWATIAGVVKGMENRRRGPTVCGQDSSGPWDTISGQSYLPRGYSHLIGWVVHCTQFVPLVITRSQ